MRKSKGWMEPDETRSSCLDGPRLLLLLLRRYPNSTPAASSSPDCPPWPILTGGNPQASRFPPKPHRHAQHLRNFLFLQPQRHQPPCRRARAGAALVPSAHAAPSRLSAGSGTLPKESPAPLPRRQGGSWMSPDPQRCGNDHSWRRPARVSSGRRKTRLASVRHAWTVNEPGALGLGRNRRQSSDV